MSRLSFFVPRVKDKQLKDEMDSLTPEEIQEAEDDKFGRNQIIIEETPQVIQDAFERLAEEIQELPEKEAYELAEMHCPGYVRSTDFRLMFLRSTKFNATQAARKMVKFWSRKVELFGPDRAFRKLSILDFEEDEADLLALNSGGFQAFPETDDAGRAICFSNRDRWTNNSKSMVRVFWFVCHVLAEDEDAQKHGMVGLITNLGASFRDEQPSESITQRRNSKITRICWRDVQQALPVQAQASHVCISSPMSQSMFVKTSMFVIGKFMLARMCVYSAYDDFLLGLDEHGIGTTIRPTEIGGTLDFDYEEWLEERRRAAVTVLEEDEIVG